jgi:hypothetical protein
VITMSRKELTRLRVLIDVAEGRLSVADATGLIGVGRRRIYRFTGYRPTAQVRAHASVQREDINGGRSPPRTSAGPRPNPPPARDQAGGSPIPGIIGSYRPRVPWHAQTPDRAKCPAHPSWRRHLIETTARPLFQHPRHRTRSLRSSTLV